MSEEVKVPDLDLESEEIYKTVDNVNSKLHLLETFIARRFDEISMEINATSQQMEMSEDGISQRFSDILEVLGAINYSGEGDSAANTGVELQAVIEQTEQAANKILDAADGIIEAAGDDQDWDDKATRDELRQRIQNSVQDIVMACTFQDLAGQRIQNTLDNLHNIEEKLNSTFEKLGIDTQSSKSAVEEKVKKGVDQGDVDALFDEDSGKKDDETSDTASQGDIDSMFD